MASLITELNKLSSDIGTAAGNMVGSVKGAVQQLTHKAPVAPPPGAWSKFTGGVGKVGGRIGEGLGAVIKAPFQAVGWVIKQPFKLVGEGMKGSANAALHVIEQPFAWGVKAVRGGVNVVGGFYKNAPLVAVPVTLIAAGLGIHSAVQKRAAKHAAAAAEAQEIAMIQAQMAAPPQGTTVAYPLQQAPTVQVTAPVAVVTTPAAENTVTPTDAELLQSRWKGANGPQTGHAEAITAARQQPGQVAASL